MIELLTPEEMARADALAIAGGRPGTQLMEAAGVAVADAVATRHPFGVRILALAGPGNNGGDAFVAARILKERGYPVELMALKDPAGLKGDAALARDRWRHPVLPPDPAAAGPADIVVDGLFGAGLDREVTGPAAALVDAVTASGAEVVAIDLPSGVSGRTGAVLGTAIHAHHTVTFFRRKPGHLLFPGRARCGRVTVADIGIPERVLAEIGVAAFVNDPALWRAAVPVPAAEGHKYGRGHAVVVSGGADSTGAARLAAGAALRFGAGLVTVASPAEALAVNAAQLTAVMVRAADGPDGLAALLSDARLNAVVIGPGLGADAAGRAMVEAALAAGRAAVLDADAITAFADDPAHLFAILSAGAAAGGPGAVLTPHEGEFARLFPDLALSASGRDRSKIDRAREAARRSGAVVLLKGPDTTIASPDGRAAVNANAPPYLATAGAGDVLAGMIGAMLAQGVTPFEAAAIASHAHGEAAATFGPGLTAEDIAPALPPVIRRLFAAREVDAPQAR